jgi:hypothetical protein
MIFSQAIWLYIQVPFAEMSTHHRNIEMTGANVRYPTGLITHIILRFFVAQMIV